MQIGDLVRVKNLNGYSVHMQIIAGHVGTVTGIGKVTSWTRVYFVYFERIMSVLREDLEIINESG